MGNARGMAASDVRHVEFKREHAIYIYDVHFKYEFDYPLLINGTVLEFRDVTFCFVKETHRNGEFTTYTGMAVLHPGEAFSRPAGRETALNKVLTQSLDMSEDERSDFKFAFYNVEIAATL